MSIADAGLFQGYSLELGFGGTTTSVFTSPVPMGGLLRRDGRFSILSIGAFSGTLGTAGVINFTGNMINPPGPVSFPIWVINNGSTVIGTLTINGDGTGTISVGYGGNFTSGICGIQTCSVAYSNFLQPPYPAF